MYILGLKGLKELLRTYKLSLLLNEYGDSNFISNSSSQNSHCSFFFRRMTLCSWLYSFATQVYKGMNRLPQVKTC